MTTGCGKWLGAGNIMCKTKQSSVSIGDLSLGLYIHKQGTHGHGQYLDDLMAIIQYFLGGGGVIRTRTGVMRMNLFMVANTGARIRVIVVYLSMPLCGVGF